MGDGVEKSSKDVELVKGGMGRKEGKILKLKLRVKPLQDEEYAGYVLVNKDAMYCLERPLEYKNVKSGTSFSSGICDYVKHCVMKTLDLIDEESIRVQHTDTDISNNKLGVSDSVLLKLRYQGDRIPDYYQGMKSLEAKNLMIQIEKLATESLNRTFSFNCGVEVIAMYLGSLSIILAIRKISDDYWCAADLEPIKSSIANCINDISIHNAEFVSLSITNDYCFDTPNVTMKFRIYGIWAEENEICKADFIGRLSDIIAQEYETRKDANSFGFDQLKGLDIENDSWEKVNAP